MQPGDNGMHAARIIAQDLEFGETDGMRLGRRSSPKSSARTDCSSFHGSSGVCNFHKLGHRISPNPGPLSLKANQLSLNAGAAAKVPKQASQRPSISRAG